MTIQSLTSSFGGFTIIAETPEEIQMLSVAVAALESVFPNIEDRGRPTPHLLLFEVLKMHSIHLSSPPSK